MLELRAEMQMNPHGNECDLFCPILTKFAVDGRHLSESVLYRTLKKKMSNFLGADIGYFYVTNRHMDTAST
jgi:hypothetical protein